MLHIVLLVPPLLLLCAGLLLLHTGFLVITVHGQSMSPTLRHGDRILVVRRWLAGRPRTGQVVVFAIAEAPDLCHDCYVKRVTAVAGETVAAPWPLPEGQQWQIPGRHLFVCGDNREASIDSRVWGPLPLRYLRGRMIIKLPPGRDAGLPCTDPVVLRREEAHSDAGKTPGAPQNR